MSNKTQERSSQNWPHRRDSGLAPQGGKQPASGFRNGVLRLQRAVGNQAALRFLQRKCSCGGGCSKCQSNAELPHDEVMAEGNQVSSPLLQRKCSCGGTCSTCQSKTGLPVGRADDHYEREADQVAARVMRMRDPSVPLLQRKCAHCEEEEMQRAPAQIQRSESAAGPDTAPPIVHDVLQSPGQPLDSASRTFFEPRFGHDLSSVRIHTDAKAAESAHAVNALAYTVGNHIAFAGTPDPHLVAHELVHVLQQTGNRVPAATSQSEASPPPVQRLALQRQTATQFTPGVMHNHRPSRRWQDVRMHPSSGFWESIACYLFSPRKVADLAMWREFSDKPTALRHLRWYLTGGGAEFNENANLDRFVRSSETFRRNFAAVRRFQTRGFMEVPQAFYGPGDRDFQFSFGAIDRMDYEIDQIAGTIHLWFKDRYEYHPVYPFYSHFPDDEVRSTNCVHAAMVELKDQGAADFWMVGEATFPMRLFVFEPNQILDEERAESVRGAISFLDNLREQLAVARAMARREITTAAGVADGSRRAHRVLNHTIIRTYLANGRRLYEAQRSLLTWGHPLQGRFREVYFRFLSEVRGAFDEALAMSRHDQQAEQEEQTSYGESLLLWMEASPMRETVMAGRPAFTAALTSRESDLSAVLTTVAPNLNLAQPGMPARARNAINNAVGRNPDLLTDPARTWATGPVPGLADAALAQIDQAEQTMDRGRTLLHAAIPLLDVWLQAPAQPSNVADRVNELFHTRDPGYGRLIRDRLQLMLDNLEGRGTLFAHIHRPDDTSTCTTATVLGQVPRAYEFVFCHFSTNVDRNSGVLLHELSHAVIPGRGTRASAQTGAPLDRAYSGERLMLRMSTEEALNNAESYAQLVQVLAGLTPESIPTDTVTGCADPAPLQDAIALAQSAHRRAWSYLEEARDALNTGGTIQPWLRALIDTHLGSPSDALLRTMLTDFGNLQGEATLWSIGHTFSCVPASLCPSSAIAFENRHVYRDGSTISRSSGTSRTPRICPAFFNITSADQRARAAHVIVSLSFGDSFLLHPERAWGYASLAMEIYRRDIGAAPAASLAEHQAADAAASAPTHP